MSIDYSQTADFASNPLFILLEKLGFDCTDDIEQAESMFNSRSTPTFEKERTAPEHDGLGFDRLAQGAHSCLA